MPLSGIGSSMTLGAGTVVRAVSWSMHEMMRWSVGVFKYLSLSDGCHRRTDHCVDARKFAQVVSGHRQTGGPKRPGRQAPRRPPGVRGRDQRLYGGHRPGGDGVGDARLRRPLLRGPRFGGGGRESVEHHPEVVAAYTVAGEASAILHVRAED